MHVIFKRPQHRIFVKHALSIVAATLLGITLIAWLAPWWWVAEILTSLRVQQSLAAVPLLLIALLGRAKLAATLASLALLMNASWVVPSIVPTASSDAKANWRVSTVNVLSSNRQFDLIEQELLKLDSDVIAIIELSLPLQHRLSAGRFAEIYPFRFERGTNRGNFGIGLYSKTPLLNPQAAHFGDPSIESIVSDVIIDEQTIRIFATHTLPPMSHWTFENRNRHLRLLAQQVASIRADVPRRPVIVMGDLNTTPWSPIFKAFMKTAQLQTASSGQGCQPTWYRWNHFSGGLVLDHVLFTNDLRIAGYQVGEPIGSDHRSVTAGFAFALQ